MRTLTKGVAPNILNEQALNWTNELLSTLAVGDDPTTTQKTRYNHRDIKQAILAETKNKCAYCESLITHIDHGDIEHIVPKSKVPSRAFDWQNLTLACRKCNQNKGVFHGGDNDHSGLVDPYIDDPDDYFLFFREVITPRPDNEKGALTNATIKLSRIELLERRRERLDFIDGLISNYHKSSDAMKPIIHADIIKRATSSENEYCGVGARYIQALQARNVL